MNARTASSTKASLRIAGIDASPDAAQLRAAARDVLALVAASLANEATGEPGRVELNRVLNELLPAGGTSRAELAQQLAAILEAFGFAATVLIEFAAAQVQRDPLDLLSAVEDGLEIAIARKLGEPPGA